MLIDGRKWDRGKYSEFQNYEIHSGWLFYIHNCQQLAGGLVYNSFFQDGKT